MSKEDAEGAEFMRAMQLNGGAMLGMVMKAAIELDLFQVMAKLAAGVNGTSPFGDDARKLSCDDILAHIPTTQQQSAAQPMLERILMFLASKSILKHTVITGEDGKDKCLYGLESICKYYISDEDGASLSPLLLMLHDKVIIDSWHHMKDAVVEGGVPFEKAHGMHGFAKMGKDSRFNHVFNQAMHNHTTIIMKNILQVYTGFKEITQIIDVAGGTGATLARIISKYPKIRGINFDLPHVIKTAAPLAGVEHVGGDMFESVPKGEVIFLKWILHDWSDEHCLKLLKNCYNSLPEFGKIIVVDLVVPDYSNTADSSSKSGAIYESDMFLLTASTGGKERSMKEFQALGKESGFAAVKLICSVGAYGVLEFYKKV